MSEPDGPELDVPELDGAEPFASGSLRIAVLGDIHYGQDDVTKRGSAGLSLLEGVVDELNARPPHRRPDLLVDLGDRINDADEASDREHLAALRAPFARLSVPRVHLLGNHDVAHLPLATSEAVLGSELRHRSTDLGGWHLIFWYGDVRYEPGLGNLELKGADLAWLEDDLEKTRLPSVLFSHVPISGASMVGNYYFEQRPESRAAYRNAKEARALVEKSGQVVAAVAGHVHWNSLHTVDGVHHLTVQSLTETFTTPPQPAGAWAELELADSLSWRVHGLDGLTMTLPLRRPGAHWLAYGGKARPVGRDRLAAEFLRSRQELP